MPADLPPRPGPGRGPARPRGSRPTAALLVAASAALLLAGAPARAQDESQSTAAQSVVPEAEDYDIANRQWNGLHTLTAVARGLGLRVQATSRAQWDELGAGDILVILYPESRLDPSHAVSFIRNGGHVLIADDFGDSVEVLGRLGMLRAPGGGVSASRFYRDIDYAPVAVPMMPEHPLAAGVGELVTNVPSVLEQVRGADKVFGFGPAATVVAAGTLGRGRFVVVSDASLFINRMLQFEGNLQFVINTIRYLTREGRTNRLVLLTREFDLGGEPVALFSSNSVRDTVSEVTIDVNRLLDEGNDYLLTEWALRVLALLLAAGVAALAVWVVPSVRRGALDGEWTRAAASNPIESYDVLVERYDEADAKQNFVLPAAILRDNLDHDLARILRQTAPLTGLPQAQLVELVETRCGDQAAAALTRVYPHLEPLPVRHQAASPVATRYVSRRDFERLHREVADLYRALGTDPRTS